MKKILLISPHFPPTNGADMHRVRMNVNYFESLGWQPTVVCVNEKHIETLQDELLIQTIPKNINIIKVNAFSVNLTRKIGLGALALRSLIYYFFVVNKLLKKEKFDLIFFSTTQFPVLILGKYWKWRFKIKYIIDMQDPWHSDFYRNKPKNERPQKYWFSYYLNKFLEPIAMKSVSGIVSVSQGYCDMLQTRYANITPDNCIVIPFGAFEKDFEIINKFSNKVKKNDFIDINYIGRGGADMSISLEIIFKAFNIGLEKNSALFSKIKLNFIGTSYSKTGLGVKTIEPLAIKMGLENFVKEYTDRIPYFETIKKLKNSDMLIIPGSSDANYTASKLYPYILSKKPILAVFSKTSSVIEVLKTTNSGKFITFDLKNLDIESKSKELFEIWKSELLLLPYLPQTNWATFETYSAKEMTKKQVIFFDKILK